MKQIPVQQDDVTSLAAADFNQMPREQENLITSSGQSLSESDLFQMAKASANYSATGDSYIDTGVANLYDLSPPSDLKGITEFDFGTKVRFKVKTTNTSTACTADVNGLGALSLHIGQLPNGGTPSVPIGFLAANKIVQITWDATPNFLTNYLRIEQVSDAEIADVSLNKFTNGQASIESGNNHMDLSAGELFFELDDGVRKEFLQLNKDEVTLGNNNSSSNLKQSTITETLFRRNSIELELSGRGIRYKNGPGEATHKAYYIREAGFTYTAGGAWADPSGAGIWKQLIDFATDIPFSAKVTGATVIWSDAGQEYASAAYVNTKDTGNSLHTIDELTICTGQTGVSPTTTFTVVFRYNGSGL